MQTPNTTNPMNSSVNIIHQPMQEMKSLRCQFKVPGGEERVALTELHSVLQKRLVTLRRTKGGKEMARKEICLLFFFFF